MKKLSVLALLLFLAASTSGFAIRTRLPFIEDDYPRALAEASRRKLPVFVEVWAPW